MMINMIKNKLTYIFIILIVAVVCVLVATKPTSKENNFSITNNTNVAIVGLKIVYSYSSFSVPNTVTKNEMLPTISQNDTYNTVLKLPEDFHEGAIMLQYLDKQGNPRKEYIEGYVDGAYKFNNKVIIESADGNGILKLKIEK